MKHPYSALLFLMGLQLIQAARLDSEIHYTFGIATDSAWINYAYDARGNLVSRNAYAGSLATPMGVTALAYNDADRLIRETTTFAGDTLSSVEYSYGLQAKPVAIAVFGTDGVLRFSDSVQYDAVGKVLKETRQAGDGRLISMRIYTYDESGILKADTLFEPVDSLWAATQSREVEYRFDGAVQRESYRRVSGGVWYPWKTAFMEYSAGRLISLVERAGDGGAALLDSTFYGYDGSGARILEEHFDEERELTARTVFHWSEGTVALRFRPGREKPPSGSRISRPGIFIWGRQGTDLLGKVRFSREQSWVPAK